MPTQITAWRTERGEIVDSEPQAVYYELCFNFAKARDEFARAKRSLIRVMDDMVGELGNRMVEAAKEYTDSYLKYRTAMTAMHKFELSRNMERIYRPDYESYGDQIPFSCSKCENDRAKAPSQ